MNCVKTFSKNVLISVECSDCGKQDDVDTDTSIPCERGSPIACGHAPIRDGLYHNGDYTRKIKYIKSVDKGQLFELPVIKRSRRRSKKK